MRMVVSVISVAGMKLVSALVGVANSVSAELDNTQVGAHTASHAAT